VVWQKWASKLQSSLKLGTLPIQTDLVQLSPFNVLSNCEVNNSVFLGCITKMENRNIEQCYAIKLCIKLHKRTMEEYESSRELMETKLISSAGFSMAQGLSKS